MFILILRPILILMIILILILITITCAVYVCICIYIYVCVCICMYVYVCIGQVFDGYDRPVMRHITEHLHNKYTPEKCRGTHHDWLYG